ncbi:MAG: sigma-70 family RNA polymerase sigma factor [Firmicutes bacterium]|nr:sigma-70 family RNA polymerase sigma factor [Bacillota bacterium]
MERLTDEQLAILVLAGDSQAFAQIVERYQKQIFALAYRLGGDYDEAKDMAQEAFIRVYNEMHRYDPNRRFFPWMYRVAHNCCINLLQKRPKETLSLSEAEEFRPSQNETFDPEAQYAQREFDENLNRALQQLPEHYRTPIVLKYLEGLSYQQISAYLGISQSTLESRLFRGRNMLRKLLKEDLK